MSVKNVPTDRESSLERLLPESLRARAASDATDRCLDADTLAAWADETLGARERSAAERHAADCARCQAMIAAMARTASTTVAAPWWRGHLMAWVVPVSAAAVALTVWSVWPVRPMFETRQRTQQVANAEPPASPPLTARSEATVPARVARPAPPEAMKTEAAKLQEKDRALRDAGVPAEPLNQTVPPSAELRRADASEEKPANAAVSKTGPPARSLDAVGEARPKAVAEAVAVATPPAPPPPPPAAPSPATAPATAAPAAPERSAFAASRAAVAGATSPPAADRLSARERAVGLDTMIVSPNPLNRWRPVIGGAVQHSTDGGSTWQMQQTGVTTRLTAGASPSALVCWLVGPRGLVVLSTNGRSWKQVPLSEAIDLVSVRATDDKTATVTASDGHTFGTADGGATWRRF